MRTDKALKNSFVAVASNLLTIIFLFAIKKIFNDILGAEYLGVSGLFSSLMSGLSIVELGFGNAIVYNMYRPVAENDIEQIKRLSNFYKKVYDIIILIILFIGIIMLPFIDIFVGDIDSDLNLELIFLLYIADVVASYLAAYKRSILYANQETYITTIIHTIVLIATYILQIVTLKATKSFYAFLIVSIILRLAENIIINYIANKKYPYILQKADGKLDDETIYDIKQKVKGLFFHKISSFLVLGTDNIIISMVPGLGVVIVGIYSAYSLIVSKFQAIIDSIFNSLTATVGNLLVENDTEKTYRIFKNIFFINVWVYILGSVGFYYVSFPFIELWMGKDFVLDKITVFIITLKLFISGLRASFGCFKNAAGIFYEDRYVPIIESIVNLISSIPLAYVLGLKGVLIGTIISTMVLYIYTMPKFVYGKIFEKSVSSYVKDILKTFLQFSFIFIITGVFISQIDIASTIYSFIYRTIVCLIIPNILILFINHRTNEFVFVKKLTIKIFKKIFRMN